MNDLQLDWVGRLWVGDPSRRGPSRRRQFWYAPMHVGITLGTIRSRGLTIDNHLRTTMLVRCNARMSLCHGSQHHGEITPCGWRLEETGYRRSTSYLPSPSSCNDINAHLVRLIRTGSRSPLFMREF